MPGQVQSGPAHHGQHAPLSFFFFLFRPGLLFLCGAVFFFIILFAFKCCSLFHRVFLAFLLVFPAVIKMYRASDDEIIISLACLMPAHRAAKCSADQRKRDRLSHSFAFASASRAVVSSSCSTDPGRVKKLEKCNAPVGI